MSNLSNFSERLQELITEKDVTIEKLSEIINYPKAAIYHWRAGDYMPSLCYVIALADYFECTIDFLVGKDSENRATTFNKCPAFSERFFTVVKQKSNFNKIIKSTGISSSTIYSWINKKYQPQIDNIVKISNALDCSIDYLVGREK